MPWSILVSRTCSVLNSILQVSEYYKQVNKLIEVAYNIFR